MEIRMVAGTSLGANLQVDWFCCFVMRCCERTSPWSKCSKPSAESVHYQFSQDKHVNRAVSRATSTTGGCNMLGTCWRWFLRGIICFHWYLLAGGWFQCEHGTLLPSLLDSALHAIKVPVLIMANFGVHWGFGHYAGNSNLGHMICAQCMGAKTCILYILQTRTLTAAHLHTKCADLHVWTLEPRHTSTDAVHM